MSDLLFSFLVNAVWQVALIAGLGLLLARFSGSARQRFELLALTLIACVAAPVLTFAPQAAVVSSAVIVIAPRAANALTSLYFAGLAIAAIRFAVALLKARRILATSLPFRGRIRLSHRIGAPVTIGRTVIVPNGIDRRLIAHEHAHVRRGDYFVHLALELLSLPLYFQPMLILLRRAIADAREMACDEEAAARHGRRAYAVALVRLASRACPALIIGIASTSIERRVASLLRERTNTRPRPALSIVLFIAAAACTRFNAAPAAQATLRGEWVLAGESRPRYDAWHQTILQEPSRITVRQERVRGGRTEIVSWNVVTDGVTRPVGGLPNARGKGEWRDGKLLLQMSGPGRHQESGVAFIRNDRLVCEGQSDRRPFHVEFRRVSR